MDLKIQHQSLHIQILKKIITPQLLFSVSVFSFFFAQSSWLSFSRNSFNFYFSNFPFQYLFRHTIDKNCMFLLCNGLLVFVAKFSGLTTSFSGSSEEFSTLERKTPFENEVLVQSFGSALTDKAMETVKEREKEEQEEREMESVTEDQEEDEEEERRIIVAELYEKENDMLDGGFDLMEEIEGNGMMMSNEELKRKFDDFIRRIKEGIRIEAQQQLIRVN